MVAAAAPLTRGGNLPLRLVFYTLIELYRVRLMAVAYWHRHHRTCVFFLFPGRTRPAQLLVATYSSNQAIFSSASAPEPVSALSHPCHNCNRHAANMSANVGVSLSLYHGRCRWAWRPYCPDSAYQHTTTVATNQAIGAARPTANPLHTCGSCNPNICLASPKATSTLQRRQ